jgi:hypothetical protein
MCDISNISKICEDFHCSRGDTGINNTGGKLTNDIVDTGGKFTASVSHTGGQIFFETYSILIAVTLAANLPPVRCQMCRRQIATGVNKDGGELPLVSTIVLVNIDNSNILNIQIAHIVKIGL